ncbi:TIGR03084 family metal-binding protein [Nocardioides euryhalodurans]|uniref:TIGR03084 family protein n=1 Tax=Nocardioides euryhalodurans TaxID=2518370 RepID=A0A4P7GMP0_9ACTN|nr:TIGR03084 family metal-binding protein [Nocardioides euryhalodurans]QBR93051.1 TIGR03084 family protein [Nocardioides euryhalodurans]
MNDVLEQVLADLDAEGARLDALLDDLPEDDWRRPTPAHGWDVATQVAHLAWTDEAAVLAATDKAAWDTLLLDMLEDPEGVVDRTALEGGRVPPEALLARWHTARRSLADALRAHPPGGRMPWFGPPMSATSMATARFMETWAHGLDVHDGLGARPEPTDRIRHVAHLGVRTRGFAFVVHGQEAPTEEVRVELTAPSGDLWTWGPADAAQSVRGSAYDFCLLVTQRVHRLDTALVAQGRDANTWLEIAQCFAGPPGGGREPGSDG